MANTVTRILFRPGWRLRCIDPPIAWIRIDPPTVQVRLQLTSYLTSRYARPVWIKELRLSLPLGHQTHYAGWVRSVDAADKPLGETLDYEVAATSPHHAFVDFAIDSRDLVAAVQKDGEPIPAVVEALLNDATELRKVATLELSRPGELTPADGWRRVVTGRELDPPA